MVGTTLAVEVGHQYQRRMNNPITDICRMQPLHEKLTLFYRSLKPPKTLPPGIDILFPQKDKHVMELVEKFFQKYFDNDHPRRLMLGINPGRFGAGITGINFTAPKQLKEICEIDHSFKLSSELSAEFIYEMIKEYGGVKRFYNDWFIGAVCPLGFIGRPTPTFTKKDESTFTPSKGGDDATQILKRDRKNMNYYDDKKLQEAVRPFIVDSMNKLMALGFVTDKCLCIGGEKNFKFLAVLNKEHKWFGEIVPLPHPRFILQYRRKQKDQYIQHYLSVMKFE